MCYCFGAFISPVLLFVFFAFIVMENNKSRTQIKAWESHVRPAAGPL